MIATYSKKRLLLGVITLVLITLPLTLFLNQQRQDVRQRAAILEVEGNLPPVTEREVGSLIVKHKENGKIKSVSTDEIAKKVNLQVEKRLEKLDTEIITVQAGKEAETIVALRNDPNVEYIEPDVLYAADYIPNDPEWSKQYALPKISAPQAWDKTRGNGIRVAVLDSGIDLDHPDLASKIAASQNFTSATSATDVHGHGTHVAGIVASITGNGIGTAGGCPGCQLMNAKVLRDDGKGSCSDIAEGITWAADNGAKVLTMSLGSSNGCQTYEDAINYAWSKGAIVVATAGNNGDQTIRYPAYYPNVIAVAATNSNDEKHTTSSYGTWVDVAAPGASIYSTIPDGYGYKSGTSMAAPLVSAVAALIWSTPHGTSNTAVRQQLQNSSDRINGTGTYWIYGRINAERAVAFTAPTPIPTPQGMKGWLDTASCGEFVGWACDPVDYSRPVEIHFYDGPVKPDFSNYIGKTLANAAREQGVANECGGYVAHGYNFKPPASIMDGKTRSIKAFAIGVRGDGNNPELNGSPKSLTCASSPTPTRVPTPTPTRIPTPTPTRVPTPSPTGGSSTQATKLQLTISLHGIARSGDNVNPGSLGNLNPRTTQRSAVVEVFNNTNTKVLQKSLTLAFNSSSGNFTGIADLGSNFPSGSYTIKVKMPMYLRRTVPGFQTIVSGSTEIIPLVTLIAGDANNDNILNILDYSLIVGCFSDLLPAKDCDAARKSMTDFTDDGNVNQLDYNLFLREMSIQSGD